MLMITADSTTDQRTGAKELDALIGRVAAGDRAAMAELYQRARGPVYAMALGILKNAQDAQDVTQDTFVQVWERAEQYRPGSPMAWLLTVARNMARMRLRRDARKAELAGEEWDAIPASAPRVTPEDRAVLQTALGTLGDRERQIVLLHAVTGLKHRQIAALLEMSLPAVLSKYHRAIKKLRVQLEGDDAS